MASGPSSRGDLRPGTRIGEYKVREVIGRGGMGTVYRATHREIGSAVAIKVLAGDWGGAAAPSAERFLREARAASRVRHINVVQVFSLGRLANGGLFYVMELLDGVPLRSYLAEHGVLDPLATLAIVKALASALDVLHASSVVHRDLKPANVFMVRPDLGISEAQVKLLDFGVARLLDARPGSELVTQTDAIIGTPAYMSPEQCRGRAVGPRGDIYALGVMTFEMLSGERPYAARSVGDLALQQQAAKRRSLHQVAPALPPELDAPIQRALETDPASRFCRAGDFARALALACGVDTAPTGPPAPLRSTAAQTRHDQEAAATVTQQPLPIGGTISMVLAPPRRGVLLVALAVALVGVGIGVTVLVLPPGHPGSGARATTLDAGLSSASSQGSPPPQTVDSTAAVAAPLDRDAASAGSLTSPAVARDAAAAGPAIARRSKRSKRSRRSKRSKRPIRRGRRVKKARGVKDRVVRDMPVRF